MTHFYMIQALLIDLLMYRVSMPSQADDSFLPVKMIDHFEDASVVSMPSQADDSFLRGIEVHALGAERNGVNALSG